MPKKIALSSLVVVISAILLWYCSIPTPNEKRWEEYCYPDAGWQRVQVFKAVEVDGYDLQFIKIENGQPGWWYLRGEPYSPDAPCLIMHYWYTIDRNGDGIREKGWPFAEYIPVHQNHCCELGGY